jgi:hypothetical protein
MEPPSAIELAATAGAVANFSGEVPGQVPIRAKALMDRGRLAPGK